MLQYENNTQSTAWIPCKTALKKRKVDTLLYEKFKSMKEIFLGSKW